MQGTINIAQKIQGAAMFRIMSLPAREKREPSTKKLTRTNLCKHPCMCCIILFPSKTLISSSVLFCQTLPSEIPWQQLFEAYKVKCFAAQRTMFPLPSTPAPVSIHSH
jgi:hypothetical protein